MTDVVVIGGASLNTIVTLDALPDPRPQTVTARRHGRALGGTSAGKSLHLASRGRSTLCVTVVGDDDDSATILESLRAEHLEVLALRGSGASEHHLNLMTDRGERLSIYLDHAPAARIASDERARVEAALDGARAIALDLSALGLEFINAAVAAPAPVWVDLHDYDGAAAFHLPFIAAADVVIMNDDGMADPVPFLRAQVARGAFAAVCTLGADGAVGIAADGTAVRVAAADATVVDTNGAGDAFAAGMIDEVLRSGAHGALAPAALGAAMRAGAAQAAKAVASTGVGPS